MPGLASWLVAGRQDIGEPSGIRCVGFEVISLNDRSRSQSEHSFAKSGEGAKVPADVRVGCGPHLPVQPPAAQSDQAALGDTSWLGDPLRGSPRPPLGRDMALSCGNCWGLGSGVQEPLPGQLPARPRPLWLQGAQLSPLRRWRSPMPGWHADLPPHTHTHKVLCLLLRQPPQSQSRTLPQLASSQPSAPPQVGSPQLRGSAHKAPKPRQHHLPPALRVKGAPISSSTGPGEERGGDRCPAVGSLSTCSGHAGQRTRLSIPAPPPQGKEQGHSP